MKPYNIKNSILFFVMLLLTACGNGLPSNVLPKEKMEPVIWDLALASEFSNGFIYYKFPQVNRVAINNAMIEEVLKIHKISRKEFDKTLEYYKQNPKVLMVILDSVVAKKTRMNATPANTLPPPAITPPIPPGQGRAVR